MKCNKCEYDNNRNANYCVNCGEKIPAGKIKKRRALEEYKPQNSKINLITTILSVKGLWITLSVFLASLLIYSIIESDTTNALGPNSTFLDQKSENPFIEAKVFEIASNFACGCGSCNEESLDICKCNYAVEERKFIRDYLDNSVDEMTVINAVISKYGGLKSGVGLEKYQKSQMTPAISNQSTSTVSKLASISDRVFIYSQFRCPCGQCDMDELKDCTCDHPKGAKEVKKFIDTKIMEGTLSVSDIISEVDRVYGGKKQSL